MCRIITIDSLVTPDVSGYGDKIAVWQDDTTGNMLYHSACSCCPNPTKPNTMLRWTACYTWIAPGKWDWDCRVTPKHGKSIAINHMGKVLTRNKNVNHNDECFATDVMIHAGFSNTWRGSMACITISPTMWTDFISLFKIGATGTIIIIDKTSAEGNKNE